MKKKLPETTNEKYSKIHTKISHYLEVGQNSGFYWLLKKMISLNKRKCKS